MHKSLMWISLLFIPFIVFAGGSKQTNQCYTPPPKQHEIVVHVTPPPVPTPTPIPPPTPSPSPTPAVIPVQIVVITPTPTVPTPSPAPVVPQNNSNGQIWCSGPSAPGWNVSKANGGCQQKACVPLQDFKLINKIKGDGKIDLYWTGSGTVKVWKFEKGWLSWFDATDNHVEVLTQGGWFWLSNACSSTKMIDP